MWLSSKDAKVAQLGEASPSISSYPGGLNSQKELVSLASGVSPGREGENNQKFWMQNEGRRELRESL